MYLNDRKKLVVKDDKNWTPAKVYNNFRIMGKKFKGSYKQAQQKLRL